MSSTAELRQSVRGQVLRSPATTDTTSPLRPQRDDDHRKPAVIVWVVADAADVMATITYGRDKGLDLLHPRWRAQRARVWDQRRRRGRGSCRCGVVRVDPVAKHGSGRRRRDLG